MTAVCSCESGSIGVATAGCGGGKSRLDLVVVAPHPIAVREEMSSAQGERPTAWIVFEVESATIVTVAPEQNRGGHVGITVCGNQARLRLPPQAARTAGPPEGTAAPMNQSRERTTWRGCSTPPEGHKSHGLGQARATPMGLNWTAHTVGLGHVAPRSR
jgi:hypothetical protein